MKRLHFPFVMIVAASLLQGESLAALANSAKSDSAPQQASENSDKSPSDHSSSVPKNVQKDDGKARGDEFQLSSAQAKGRKHSASLTRAPAKNRLSTIHSKPAASHPLHLSKTATLSTPRPNAPPSTTGLQEVGSKTGRVAPKRLISNRNVTISPSASVNGQQFRNSRDPGARLATTGGPLIAARGTAAISGSNMRPSHKLP